MDLLALVGGALPLQASLILVSHWLSFNRPQLMRNYNAKDALKRHVIIILPSPCVVESIETSIS